MLEQYHRFCTKVDCSSDTNNEQYILDIKQMELFVSALKYIKSRGLHYCFPEQHVKPTPFLKCVLGGPGVGKTTLLLRLKERLRCHQLDLMSCAYTGNAAAISAGYTCHTLFVLPFGTIGDVATDSGPLQPLNVQSMNACKQRLLQKMVAFIAIDEISLVSAAAIERYNERLQQIYSNRENFGGMPIMLLGDWFQIPPVRATPIYKSMVSLLTHIKKNGNITNTAQDRGNQLLLKFQYCELKQQHRSVDDSHTNDINQLRDLSVEKPITVDMIKRIKTITLNDIESDENWKQALIVVTSNTERHLLNFKRAQLFAYEAGYPLLRWKNQIISSFTSYISPDHINTFYDKYPQLWTYYCPNMPVYCYDNIKTDRRLVNGSRGYMRNVVFTNSIINDQFQALYQNATPGQLVTVPKQLIPTHLFIAFPNLTPTEWQSNQCEIENSVVKIALQPIHRDQNKISIGQNVNVLYKAFPVTIGFVVTFHKMQGLTCDRLVLQLNDYPNKANKLTLPIFTVAVSRVHRGVDIKQLPLHHGANPLYPHLTKLTRPKEIKQWYNQLNSDGYWISNNSNKNTGINIATNSASVELNETSTTINSTNTNKKNRQKLAHAQTISTTSSFSNTSNQQNLLHSRAMLTTLNFPSPMTINTVSSQGLTNFRNNCYFNSMMQILLRNNIIYNCFGMLVTADSTSFCQQVYATFATNRFNNQSQYTLKTLMEACIDNFSHRIVNETQLQQYINSFSSTRSHHQITNNATSDNNLKLLYLYYNHIVSNAATTISRNNYNEQHDPLELYDYLVENVLNHNVFHNQCGNVRVIENRTCIKCLVKTLHLSITNYLNLQIETNQKRISLQALIQKHFNKSELLTVNCSYCSNTSKQQTTHLNTIPNFLAINFQRDRFTNQQINATKVIITDNLTFDRSNTNNQHIKTQQYSLHGIIDRPSDLIQQNTIHGHYTCYVRDSANDKWFYYNDSSVAETKPDLTSISVTTAFYTLDTDRN